jgi:hypothetical protein
MIQFDNAVSRYRKIILSDLKEAGVTCWIAGGAIRDYFMGVPILTDHDLFFPNQEMYDKAVVYFKAKECKVIWESTKGMKVKYGKRVFDLVKFYASDPQACINAFDFTVSMFAVDYDKVYHGETSFIDLAKRQLMLNQLTFPASTMSRAFRYYKKGFLMCQGEMKKLVEAIQNMPKTTDSTNPDDATVPPSGDSVTAFFIGID